MEIKPQNFFIGVVDFFSILLPGAIFIWFLKIQYYDRSIELRSFFKIPANEAAEIVAFLQVNWS